MSVRALSFQDIQTAVQEVIAAHAYFVDNDIAVIANDGTKDDDIEQAIAETGVCVEVDLPNNAKIRSQSDFTFELDVEIFCGLRVNVFQNASDDGAQIDVFEAVIELIRAVLRRPKAGGDERFQLASTCIMLSEKTDEGELCYIIRFLKNTGDLVNTA